MTDDVCTYTGAEHDLVWGPGGKEMPWCRLCREDVPDRRCPTCDCGPAYRIGGDGVTVCDDPYHEGTATEGVLKADHTEKWIAEWPGGAERVSLISDPGQPNRYAPDPDGGYVVLYRPQRLVAPPPTEGLVEAPPEFRPHLPEPLRTGIWQDQQRGVDTDDWA